MSTGWCRNGNVPTIRGYDSCQSLIVSFYYELGHFPHLVFHVAMMDHDSWHTQETHVPRLGWIPTAVTRKRDFQRSIATEIPMARWLTSAALSQKRCLTSTGANDWIQKGCWIPGAVLPRVEMWLSSCKRQGCWDHTTGREPLNWLVQHPRLRCSVFLG